MEKLNISFILPVLDEVDSLRVTVGTIFMLSERHVGEIIIVTAKQTTKRSMAVIDDLKRQHTDKIRAYRQKRPGLGGALQEAFGMVRGGQVMLMASDLETDPRMIPVFVRKMQEGGWDIVCGSRWLRGGGFKGYGLLKAVLNWVFQKLVSLLYGVRLTDLTFAYRLYRREALAGIVWCELKHPFLLECLLKPLRRGARVVEIPCQWSCRVEGESHGSWWQMFRYAALAVRVRLGSR